jgi:hypothetical protein
MCDLHINVKMGFHISVNGAQPIIIVSFGYLLFSCRPHTIEFFHTNLHKYQHNMYMKILFQFFWDFQIAVFQNW